MSPQKNRSAQRNSRAQKNMCDTHSNRETFQDAPCNAIQVSCIFTTSVRPHSIQVHFDYYCINVRCYIGCRRLHYFVRQFCAFCVARSSGKSAPLVWHDWSAHAYNLRIRKKIYILSTLFSWTDLGFSLGICLFLFLLFTYTWKSNIFSRNISQHISRKHVSKSSFLSTIFFTRKKRKFLNCYCHLTVHQCAYETLKQRPIFSWTQ